VKFYDLAASPNTRRVRILMAEKGLEIPTVQIDMMKGENKTPDYLAKNSLGVMPVLELDDGTCITESAAICRYLDEIHPEPPLFGHDPVERARVEMWHRRMELEILIPVIQIFVHSNDMWKGRRPQVPAYADIMRTQVTERFDWLDKELEGRDYIATDDYTIADITAQCGVLMAKAAAGIRAQPEQKNLAAWWERVSARPTARA
jgi:glutathione S-transferase